MQTRTFLKYVMIGVVAVELAPRLLPACDLDSAAGQEAVVAAKSSGDPAKTHLADPPGAGLRGITRDRQGLPLGAVKVTLRDSAGGSDCSTVSGADGSFTLEGLKPGHYQALAEKEGFGQSPTAPVELASAQNVNLDLTLSAASEPRGRRKPFSPPGESILGRLAYFAGRWRATELPRISDAG